MANLTENELQAQRLILKEINKTLDLLEGHLIKFCGDTKGTSIPLVYVTHAIKIIKENMAKGAGL